MNRVLYSLFLSLNLKENLNSFIFQTKNKYIRNNEDKKLCKNYYLFSKVYYSILKYSTKFNTLKKISNNLNAFTKTICTYWLFYAWVSISIPCTSFIFSLLFNSKEKHLNSLKFLQILREYITNNKVKKKKLYKNSFSKIIIQYNIQDISVPSIMKLIFQISLYKFTLPYTNTNSLYLRKFLPNNLNAITGKTEWEERVSPANLTSKCFFEKGAGRRREVRRVWRHRRGCNESWIVLWLVPLVMLSPDRFSLSTSPLRSFRLFSQRWISLLGSPPFVPTISLAFQRQGTTEQW